MTGDKSKFLSISFKQEGHITYGDNNKGRILGSGSIGDKDILVIHDVLYVEVLKHNLLSISQLCDKGYQVMIWVGLNIYTFKLLNTTLYENENHNSRIKECLNNENEITSTKQQAENRNGIKEA